MVNIWRDFVNKQDLEKNIPDGVLCAIKRYVEHGVEPGSFTRAVLENNLVQSFNKADEESYRKLKDICKYIYLCMPAEIWGSKERVDNYIKLHAEQRSRTLV